MNGFHSEESLGTHMEYCANNEAVRQVLPGEGTLTKFRNNHKSMKVPFVVYADLACFTERLAEEDRDKSTQYTMRYQEQKPSGFCYNIVCSEPGVYNSRPIMYTKKTQDEDIGQMMTKDTYQHVFVCELP
jgi:hypothetical protein